jgi:hypothetical protein
LRHRDVHVGHHDAPAHTALHQFLERFETAYDPKRLHRADMVLAAAASHHRLLWIHPFLDGNGRVARLFTEAYLAAAGVDSGGLWSLARGFARSPKYKALLARADSPREGDLDGRWNLSDAALSEFCGYVLDVALDQVQYIASVLDLGRLRTLIVSHTRRLVSEGELPKGSDRLILEVFLRGTIERGEALELLGGAERTARKNLSALIERGFLAPTSLSHKSSLKWAIPVMAATAYFPGLFPSDPDDTTANHTPTFVDRLRSLGDTELRDVIDTIAADHVADLSEHDEVASAMAVTNATGFGIDDYHITDIDIDLFDDEEARVRIDFHLSGDHDWESDRVFSGDEITGSAIMLVRGPDDVSFVVVSASRVEYPPDDDSEPPEDQADPPLPADRSDF